jgi:Cyclic nucleotide-binding domain
LVAVIRVDAGEPVAPFIVRSKLSTRIITINNGEMVYGEGEPSKRVFQIIRGTVATVKELPDGRRQVLAFYLPKDILGLSLSSNFCHSAFATQHAFFWIPAIIVTSFVLSAPLAWFIAPSMMMRFILARQVH